MSSNFSRGARAVGALIGTVLFSVIAGALVALLVVPFIAVTERTVSSTVGVFDSLPEDIEISSQPQQNRIFATQDGALVHIATMFSQNREEVGWDQVSNFAKFAAVSGEDRRFYEHGGVDLPGIARAAVANVAGGKISEGASTITQQYVKNTFVQATFDLPEAEQAAAYEAAVDDTFDRKLKEMKLAISLEKRYTKDEILLAYLNIAHFGGSTYGIQAAAERYFAVDASALTAAQAASLVAIVQSPGALSLDNAEHFAANLVRRNSILGSMRSEGHLTIEQYAEAIATPLDSTTVSLTSASNGCNVANDHARYFCDYVRNLIKDLPSLGATPEEREASFKHGGFDFITTLDMPLQVTAQTAVWANAPNDATTLQLGAATISVEVGTGRILTMAQNKVFDNSSDGGGATATAVNFNTDKAYGGSGGFQPGSTYKVFALLNWLQNGHGLEEVVDGSPRTEEQADFTDSCGRWAGPYPFKNDDALSGPMTVAQATQQSVNGAFISMAMQLDLCGIRDTARSIGVHRADGAELETNPSSVLGTNYIAPLSMAAAYAAIAAGGVFCEPIAIERIVASDGTELPGQEQTCNQGLEANVANTAAYAMTKVMTEGTARRANPNDGVEYIGKTGTTDSSNQTWVVGASTRVATAVWVGNISGYYPMRNYQNDLGIAGGLIRHDIFKPIALAIDAIPAYRGVAFPGPDPALITGTGQIVPDVSGQSAAEAVVLLEASGFAVAHGSVIDSHQTAGSVANTTPVAGALAPKGSAVTLNTSNGTLVTMPDVVSLGSTAPDMVAADLRGRGFPNITISGCAVVDPADPGKVGTVVGSVPTAGTPMRGTDPVTLNLGALAC